MKKRILSLLIFIASVLTGGFLLSANVAAAPTLPTTPTTPVETPAETPKPDETKDDTKPTDEAAEKADEAKPVNNCTDQMGKMAWAICPITGVIATATDTALALLQDLLVVNMQSDVFESPLYHIWGYIRNIANILFIIFFLVIIFSHFTQWNISAYALRRIAPKLLVVAILINLSFYISVGAVNISDILGVSFVGLFDSIAEGAAANGAMNLADIPTWEALVAAATGATVVGGGAIAALAVAGGFSGLFYMLLPVILGAVVAVVAALFTMAARQALIFLLVMLSPVAFASMLLSGTENLFNMWKKFFLQMLIIFPMFSLLYGAARLAGWAIIATADGMLQVVLGMAVQVVPLVMTPALLRMSGTVLGKVNELARKPFAPAQNALKGYSAEQQAVARARQVNAGMRGSYAPSAKLAAFLEKQKALRGENLAIQNKSATFLVGSYVDNYVAAHGKAKNGNLQLKHGIGYDAKQVGVDELHAGIANLNRSSTLNEASGWSGEKNPPLTSGQRRMQQISGRGTQAWMELWTAEQRKAENDFGDEQYRNERLNAAYRAHETHLALKGTKDYTISPEELAKINDYNAFVKPVSGDNPHMDAIEAKVMQDRAVSRAMSMNNMMNKKTRDAYATLFSDTKLTYDIQRSLRKSFAEKDWNKMEAAIDVMAVRGDYNLITDEIAMATDKGYLYEYDENGNIIADVASEGNKRLMDTLVKYKNEAAHLAMYAKSMNIRRGKWGNFEGKIQELMNKNPHQSREEVETVYFTNKASKKFAVDATEVTEEQVAIVRQEQADSTRRVSMVEWAGDKGDLGMLALLGNITQPGIAKSQDRTTFEAITDLMKAAGVKPSAGQAGFLVKQLRSAACSGEIDGETLANLNTLLIGRKMPGKAGGSNEGWDNINYESIFAYLGDMSAKQLASMKAGQFSALNDALMQEDGAYAAGKISPIMLELINNAMFDIANGNRMLMSEMNTDIRRKINIDKMNFKEGDKRDGSDQYLFDGDPSRPNAPLFSELEPDLLDVYARNAKGADLVSFATHSDLLKKLNDYHLDRRNKVGSFDTGQVADEIREYYSKLSPAEQLLLDDEMRVALGLNTKKPNL
ncbi:MAG: MFS transporter [Candidatus Nomurabacteria bacterium]|jgi:hypothetical protein|nr:MFS transporter [Candidatus Nomurabacteria bacterium]